jgi:O-antigen ligase
VVNNELITHKQAKVIKASHYLYIITFMLFALILPTGFIHEKASRVIFYWCGYLSVLGLLLNSIKIKRITINKNLTISYMLPASIFLVWSILSHYIGGENNSSLLYTPAKRWIIASFISLYILNGYHDLPLKVNAKKILMISMLSAFILSTISGVVQGVESSDRILLGIDRAPLTAYAYSAFTLALSAIISREIIIKYKYFINILLLVISTYIIFLTQTRSAMFIHPVLGVALLISLMYKDKIVNIKTISFALLALFFVAAFNHKIISTRFQTTIHEINAYSNGNDNTSLGARFSMWKLGYLSFIESPFGQTQVHRNAFIKNYLNENKEKSAATLYLDVHLHNEVIQYASLFGVAGVFLLITFYYLLVFKISSPMLSVGIASLSAFLYGSTDVLLTSIEYIVIFTSIMTASQLIAISNKEESKQ